MVTSTRRDINSSTWSYMIKCIKHHKLHRNKKLYQLGPRTFLPGLDTWSHPTNPDILQMLCVFDEGNTLISQLRVVLYNSTRFLELAIPFFDYSTWSLKKLDHVGACCHARIWKQYIVRKLIKINLDFKVFESLNCLPSEVNFPSRFAS
jgi:hypothetical protein